MFLTKSTTFIIGQVATLLGYLMSGIFNVLSAISGGHPKAGLAIIILTIIIYMAMLPLTIRQQKFSKLQGRMMPEIQKIQAKYKGKTDQESAMRMNEETKAVYAKYGVSPTGSCLQLLIQMPILFALYRVIYNIPAYVTMVRSAFDGLVDGFVNVIGISKTAEIMKDLSVYNQFSRQFSNANFAENVNNYATNTFIDVMNRASTSDWQMMADNALIKSNGLTDVVQATHARLEDFNSFLGLNIGDSPMFAVQHSGGKIGVIIIAVLIPILAALSQYISVKLMPQAESAGGEQNAMANQMKTMNAMMPLMSAFFCLTLPAGMGIYWIAGSVIRCVQQIFVNKHLEKLNIDDIIEANKEKVKKQQKKAAGKTYVNENKVVRNSSMSTKNINSGKINPNSMTAKSNLAANAGSGAAENSGKKYKQGSLASKANMVRDFSRDAEKK